MAKPHWGALLGLIIFLVSLLVLTRALARYESTVGPWLRHATGASWRGLLLGFAVTAAIQSSSATNAMTVGLVGARLIGLKHAFAIVLGANVGTSLTGQLIAFNVYKAALPFIGLGLVLQMIPHRSARQFGEMFVGVGGLFYGLWALGTALLLWGEQAFLYRYVSLMENNDVLALGTGLLLTAAVQSSSAVTGLLVGLADTGLIDVRSAVAAAIGSNIGTVTTTILASLAAGAIARKLALMDLVFNAAGAVLVLPILPQVVHWIVLIADRPGRQVAHAHTLFNVVTVLLAIPFIDWFCRRIEGGRRPM